MIQFASDFAAKSLLIPTTSSSVAKGLAHSILIICLIKLSLEERRSDVLCILYTVYDACEAVHLSTEDAWFDSRQRRTIEAVNVWAYTYMWLVLTLVKLHDKAELINTCKEQLRRVFQYNRNFELPFALFAAFLRFDELFRRRVYTWICILVSKYFQVVYF